VFINIGVCSISKGVTEFKYSSLPFIVSRFIFNSFSAVINLDLFVISVWEKLMLFKRNKRKRYELSRIFNEAIFAAS